MRYKAVAFGSTALAVLLGMSVGAMASTGRIDSIGATAGHEASAGSHVSSAQNSPSERGHDQNAVEVAYNWRNSVK